jgi:hypothetical protein
LLADIKDVRQAKIREVMRQISDNSVALKLDNITMMEINSVRPFIVSAMLSFSSLQEGEARDYRA